VFTLYPLEKAPSKFQVDGRKAGKERSILESKVEAKHYGGFTLQIGLVL
jgi:hypothetical protein